MADQFEAYRYAHYLRSRWRFIGLACVSALCLAALFTFVKSKEYTATARLLIEIPGGSDPRISTAISAVYLDSLRTYEQLALSDKLLQEAMEKFRLRELIPGRTIESWKSRLVKVGLVRNTRILEVAVTLNDPKQAQAVAQFIAEQVVLMNRNLIQAADDASLMQAMNEAYNSKRTLLKTEVELSTAIKNNSVDALHMRLQALDLQRTRVQRELMSDELSGNVDAARSGVLKKQLQEIDSTMERANKDLAERTARLQAAEEHHKISLTAYEAARKQYQDLQAATGNRSERLRMIDPGFVPERPSSPNLALNLAAALLFAFTASIGWLTVAFAMAGRSDD